MMDFMGPMSMMQGGAVSFTPGPSVSITSSDFGSGGAVVGYIKSGGFAATALGVSGGTLSATVLTGFVTDSVFYTPGSSEIKAYIVGDAVAALAGVSAMTIGGVPCALINGPEYNVNVAGTTEIVFYPTAVLVASTSQTIQLI